MTKGSPQDPKTIATEGSGPQAAPVDPLVPGTIVDGRYKVVRFLGQGGNGNVHEVEHLLTGRKLALKSLLDEAGSARLEQEARATSLMKNHHAAVITDMGMAGPLGPYLVMELLDGQSLRALLDDAGQLPLELTVNVGLQVCECLAEAHQHGIVHRDLKPENVMLCASPWPGQYDVKVLDFGVVKIAEAGPIPKGSLTRTGSTVGTPYYMSLEQLRNSSAVDARADIYSLGVVLYESLSGRKPFQAETIGDLVFALCSGPPTHLARLRPDLPAAIADVVMRCLDAERDKRPKSMTELANALLPHGNPAFGLWVKIDGKQPAASAVKGAWRSGTVTPSSIRKPAVATVPIPVTHVEAPIESGPRTPGPPAPPTTRRKAMTMMGVGAAGIDAMIAREKGEPWTGDDVATTQQPSRASQADIPARGQRDTPTEMFGKGEVDLDEPSTSGDRDTPTRALQLEPSMPSVPSAQLLGGAPPLAQVPQPPIAPDQIGMGSGFHRAPPIAPLAAPISDRMRPGWQLSLDRALVKVGATGESLLVRYKAAPRSTRIVILASAGAVSFALFVLFVVTLFRH